MDIYCINIYYYVVGTVLEVGDAVGNREQPCSPEPYIMEEETRK